MKILILGIGNVLFGDEGIGVHLANYLDEKYNFSSDEHTVALIDGGTLAQILIPIITDYDRVVLIDCVNVKDGNIGDVYSFDFDAVPEYITWEGSAHEVEMLQTLQMIDMLGDLPPVKIVGVIPYVIGEDTTFTITDEVLNASKTMEDSIIKYIKEFDIEVSVKNPEAVLQEVARTSYLRGTEWY
ncbi:HyaD/HybD family hydrogenase maturation endopeptidase [Sulfurimonas sp.]|uniref:HyaD/HybD family hydrogenase maturation endopeptidase n=1 Tax=Sulfurimonas sp. TaxID=2022749 RepID=UPI0025F7BBC2|nr:HyaD/HybD family hydrogenase maturation endopeptidase [Sulfurimonas sp.]